MCAINYAWKSNNIAATRRSNRIVFQVNSVVVLVVVNCIVGFELFDYAIKVDDVETFL